MNETLPVFVNDQVVRLPAGASVTDAVTAFSAHAAAQLAANEAHVTDGRGIPLAADESVHAGAILRIIMSARRVRDEADAHS